MIQQSHSWVYIWTKLLLKKMYAPCCIIGAVFTITKILKQPKCPSTDEWIKRRCGTLEHYSAIKRNETLHLQQHGWTWRILC